MIISLVAGEASGDNLGKALIKAIKGHQPEAKFIGIGGAAMIAEGMESWVDIERLSVNGLVDPLKRLPELIRILLRTRDNIIASKAECFIGIDFNFFNLLLAGMLKKRGIKTVQYVSPTVWAWRKGRIKSIARKIDLMLALYPFELEIYQKNNIEAVFVGHPKADEIDLLDGISGKALARKKYDVIEDEMLVALLPGSRSSEIGYSCPDFLAAATLILAKQPKVKFIIPAVNEKRKAQIELLLQSLPDNFPLMLSLGDAKTAMQAADVVMVNSGTATLEAMLLKKPMVMSYRLGGLSFAIITRMASTKFFALPNILSQKKLVPELMQNAATPNALAAEVLSLLESEDSQVLLDEFDKIHRSLRKNAGDSAAQAVLALLGRYPDMKVDDVLS